MLLKLKDCQSDGLMCFLRCNNHSYAYVHIYIHTYIYNKTSQSKITNSKCSSSVFSLFIATYKVSMISTTSTHASVPRKWDWEPCVYVMYTLVCKCSCVNAIQEWGTPSGCFRQICHLRTKKGTYIRSTWTWIQNTGCPVLNRLSGRSTGLKALKRCPSQCPNITHSPHLIWSMSHPNISL